MNVTPTIESLRLAVELIKAGKFSDNKVIPVAAMFDGYLCGAITAEISFDADGRPVVELSERNSHSAGCTESTPEEIKAAQIELACDSLMQLLPQKTLKLVNLGEFPAGLASVINSAALAELERRRAAEPGSDNGYRYTGSPDLGEVGA